MVAQAFFFVNERLSSAICLAFTSRYSNFNGFHSLNFFVNKTNVSIVRNNVVRFSSIIIIHFLFVCLFEQVVKQFKLDIVFSFSFRSGFIVTSKMTVKLELCVFLFQVEIISIFPAYCLFFNYYLIKHTIVV